MADHEPTILEEEEDDEEVTATTQAIQTSTNEQEHIDEEGDVPKSEEREISDVQLDNGKHSPSETVIQEPVENGDAEGETAETVAEQSHTELEEAEKSRESTQELVDEPSEEVESVENGEVREQEEDREIIQEVTTQEDITEKAGDVEAVEEGEDKEVIVEDKEVIVEDKEVIVEGEMVVWETTQEEMKVGEEGEHKDEVTEPEDVKREDSMVDESEDSERGESPIGEKLSRESSPIMDRDIYMERLEPSSPRAPAGSEIGESERSDLEEDDEEQPEFTREQLLDQYQASIAQKEQLQILNYQLQTRLADFFRKKKSEDSRQEFEKNVTDQEQRYLKYMANLEELRKQDVEVKEGYEHEIRQSQLQCEDRLTQVDADRREFIEFKNIIAQKSVNNRSGKPIPLRDIEQFLSSEMKKEVEVIHVRLENIKLKNKLKKKEQQLKSKEELAEGLHLIDFEQLKIENQTYNEKIEERNEELLKLRKKITSTVQVLTHLKEKLQFVQGENLVYSDQLKDVEHVVAQNRDILSRTKQARDALRIDNQKLRENAGLLGNEPLLRDFENLKDDVEGCHAKLNSLKMQHAENTLCCNQVRRKIDQVKTQHS